MRSGFTVEETNAILAEHYPWTVKEKKPMKLRLQAQNLQPGDVIGSGERIIGVLRNSTKFDSSKVLLTLREGDIGCRSVLWGKYTMINLERPDIGA